MQALDRRVRLPVGMHSPQGALGRHTCSAHSGMGLALRGRAGLFPDMPPRLPPSHGLRPPMYPCSITPPQCCVSVQPRWAQAHTGDPKSVLEAFETK